jgi:hypothetical protein
MASEEVVTNKAMPHDELCDIALEWFESFPDVEAGYKYTVKAALEFYKEYYVRRGERKLVYTPGKLEEALEEGWRFDPWLNPRGRPIPIGGPITVGGSISESDGSYWILVKGIPDQVAWLNPFIELPVEEEEEVEPVKPEPYGLLTEYIAYDSEGKPSREPQAGYVIMHKDHVYAKGTVYTKTPGSMPTIWDVAKGLAPHINSGVDEAHDALMAIINKEFVPTNA